MPQLEAAMAGPPGTGSHAPGTRTDVVPPEVRDRTPVQRVASLAGAVVFALLVPVVILLIGLPVVLVVRLLVEAVTWMVASFL